MRIFLVRHWEHQDLGATYVEFGGVCTNTGEHLIGSLGARQRVVIDDHGNTSITKLLKSAAKSTEPTFGEELSAAINECLDDPPAKLHGKKRNVNNRNTNSGGA